MAEIDNYRDSSTKDSDEASSSEGSSDEESRDSVEEDDDPLSLPVCARDISGSLYNLATWMDEVGSFPAKISVRSRMSVYYQFRKMLVDEKLYRDFKGTCFGQLRNIPEYFKFNGQMVHHMLLRRVKDDKKLNEI